MTRKVEIETTEKQRQVAPARVSSKGRGRPIADLVEKFERAGPGLERLASAALRAGDLVRTMRKEEGISQAELADRIGVTQSRISEIEAGTGSQGPTWDVMERVMAACNMNMQLYPKRIAADAFEESREERSFPALKAQ